MGKFDDVVAIGRRLQEDERTELVREGMEILIDTCRSWRERARKAEAEVERLRKIVIAMGEERAASGQTDRAPPDRLPPCPRRRRPW
jgi:hypothetical protein